MEQECHSISRLKIRSFAGPLTAEATNSESHETEIDRRGTLKRKWQDLHIDISPGDVIIIRGASGTGKSTLLKKIANLFSIEPGHDEHSSIELDSRPVVGTNKKDRRPMLQSNLYRSRIGYVSQRPALFAGTPLELYELLKGFQIYTKKQPNSIHPSSADLEAGSYVSSGSEEAISTSAGPGWRMDPATRTENLLNLDEEHNSTPNHSLIDLPVYDLQALAHTWGIDKKKLSTTWSKLSGGEAQRIALALAVHMRFINQNTEDAKSLKKENWITFLLDEPTSALDDGSCKTIESGLICGKAMQDVAILWITHSDAQAQRIENILSDLNRSNPTQKQRVCRTLNLGV